MRGVADALGHLAVERHRFFECGHEGGEVAVGPRLRPHLVADGAEFGAFGDKRPGNPQVVVDGLAGLRAVGSLDAVGRKPGRLGLGLVEQTAGVVRHQQVAGHHRERGLLLGAGLGAARRHHRARVPGEDLLGVDEIVDLPDAFQKCGVAHRLRDLSSRPPHDSRRQRFAAHCILSTGDTPAGSLRPAPRGRMHDAPEVEHQRAGRNGGHRPGEPAGRAAGRLSALARRTGHDPALACTASSTTPASAIGHSAGRPTTSSRASRLPTPMNAPTTPSTT